MNLRKFLFENEAVEGINSPADYLYTRILRFNLDFIRTWPRKELGEPENLAFTVFMQYFYLILNIVTVMGSTSYIVVRGSELSFIEAGLMYLIFLIGIVDTLTVVCLTFSEKFRVLAKDFLTKTHLFYYKDRSKHAMESEKLKDAVYGVPWDCMDTKNRKVVMFFLMNVQEPVHVKAMGLANVGVTTMASLTVVTLTFSDKYRVLAKDFLTKTHLFYYKDRSKHAMEIHRKIHLISHLFSLWILFQMLSGLSLFNITPMYSNFAAGKYRRGGLQNSTFEHSLYYLYPFNTSTDVTGYTVACILHWIISYLCSTWFCMFNLFLSLMVFNLWGHFKILIMTLEEFPRPGSRTINTLHNTYKYTEEELIEVAEKLKDCINYHREIKTFTNRMSDVFGPMLFIYYAFHQASGCLLLLECSQMTTRALMRYLPLTIVLTQQLIQLSVIFELLGTESEKLKDAVYGVPWECMDVKNRKVVRFFLMNVQEPVHVKAMGLANVGVTTMAALTVLTLTFSDKYRVLAKDFLTKTHLFYYKDRSKHAMESEKLKDAVYGVPWECMDVKNRKVVRFFLMNVQKPVHVKAMGLANVGVTTMAATAQALMRYVPLTIILTQQLIQLSVIFELVGSESDKLKHAVYGLPWECMDVKNRRVVLIFLANTQEPVHVKAMGVANVGVTSMAAILKTSMSYFTFLRSM
uniref:Odorant receptor n=1 Tax=Heliothis virescens TaxID=7102 RepID=A0A2A4K9J7_HELVI